SSVTSRISVHRFEECTVWPGSAVWLAVRLDSATPDGVVAEAAARLGPGGTLLLHDSDAYAAPDSWRVTLAALPHLVAYCRGLGLEVGRLGDHGHPGSGVPYGFPGRAG
ncbi:hypothetical protein ABZ630_27240, partial [Streptomyces albidoflavus]